MTKPPYKVPALAEIRQVPWNGLNVVSTFSGCGGSSTGYRMSGYRIAAAVEFVPLAQQSYELNMEPHTELVRADVRELDGAELLKRAGLERGQVDLFDGSPPCEPFSSAGQRDKKWRQVVEYSGQRQRTDDLFFEYARLVDELQPRAFVAENVEGLVRGRAKGYFLWILERLRGLGYRVSARVLDASWLGTPQVRRRVIFVGVREDLGRDPVFPDPLPYQYTTREALGDLIEPGDSVRMGSFSRKHNPPDISDRPAPTMVAGDSTYWHVDEQIVGNDAFEPRFGTLDRPSPTIMAGGSRTSGELRNSRTGQRRKLTIPEALRICGFPDDYQLAGSFSVQWERLGDSVAPQMAAAVSATLRDQILNPKETP